MYQLFFHGTFCGTNHGNSWYHVCYNHCKNSDRFQISYCTEHTYNVFCMAREQPYLYQLNCLGSILGTVPTYIYVVVLYSENDVPTKHTFFFFYWIAHAALQYSLLRGRLIVASLAPQQDRTVVPTYSLAWFLHFDQTHTVDPFVEGGDTPLTSLHCHHLTIKNM